MLSAEVASIAGERDPSWTTKVPSPMVSVRAAR
ncbi:Uncharacterised protein [Mycobacteroides abscessus subsp. massiliense]|nr:Uncharacterised protein [Mycobacteroides abscessus subsp. massiliense]